MEIPDLIVSLGNRPSPYSQQNSILDLKRFLFAGGTNHRSDISMQIISKGGLGKPKLERLPLVLAVKDELETRLIMGQSHHSTISYLATLTQFFRFLELKNLPYGLPYLEENFLIYSEELFKQSRLASAKFSEKSAYSKVNILSGIFGSILEIPDQLKLLGRTKLRKPRRAKKAISNKAEKQNLQDTFKLGVFLTDMIMGLTPEAILGALPLVINLRPGVFLENQIKLSAGLSNKEKSSSNSPDSWKFYQRRLKPDDSIKIKVHKRWQLVNLRIDAEFMMFIAQTGMNMAQAKLLKRNTFKFKPLGENWLVRIYKNRKGGEVRFNVYKEYKPFLYNYSRFLSKFFPDSDLLFPKFDKSGNETSCNSRISGFKCIRELVFAQDIQWVPPRDLRNTRVNWLLRRSGDYELTATVAQHTQKTLREKYERMSQQRAMVEVTNFWNKHDPLINKDLKVSLIGGLCNGNPESLNSKPIEVLEPNCVNSSGCLWCRHSRDVDTLDYVWSLTSFRYLKCLEASLTITKKTIPADVVVERITKKLRWFADSNKERKGWVNEAEERVSESYFHPNWAALIDFME